MSSGDASLVNVGGGRSLDAVYAHAESPEAPEIVG